MSLIAVCYPELKPADLGWIESFRKKYNPNDFKKIAPHISLVFPVDDIDPDAFTDHIRRMASRTAIIDFIIRGTVMVKGVDGHPWYLFLTPDEGCSKIEKLHDRLYTGFLKKHLRLDIPFMPHMTIGIFDDKQACKETADLINGNEFAVAGRITTIDIADYTANRIWAIERIKLTAGR